MIIKSIKTQKEAIPIKTRPTPKNDVNQPIIFKTKILTALKVRPA